MKTAAKTPTDNPAARAKNPTTKTTPVAKMTKLQVIRYVSELMQVAPKQIKAFFDLLFETVTMQTQEAGEFKVPGFWVSL